MNPNNSCQLLSYSKEPWNELGFTFVEGCESWYRGMYIVDARATGTNGTVQDWRLLDRGGSETAPRQCPDWIPHFHHSRPQIVIRAVYVQAHRSLKHARQCQVFSRSTVNTNSRGWLAGRIGTLIIPWLTFSCSPVAVDAATLHEPDQSMDKITKAFCSPSFLL